jgi:hypothetical protein
MLLTLVLERPNCQSAGRDGLTFAQHEGNINARRLSTACASHRQQSLDGFFSSLHCLVASQGAQQRAEARDITASDERLVFLRPAICASATSDCVIFSSGKPGTRGPKRKSGRVSALAWCSGASESQMRRGLVPWIAVRGLRPAQGTGDLPDGD